MTEITKKAKELCNNNDPVCREMANMLQMADWMLTRSEKAYCVTQCPLTYSLCKKECFGLHEFKRLMKDGE